MRKERAGAKGVSYSRPGPCMESLETRLLLSGTCDLSGTFGTTWALPSSSPAGGLLGGSATVVVSNLGTQALPGGQKISIRLQAQDVADPLAAPVTLATLGNQYVSGLAPNASVSFSLIVNVAGGLPAGTYQVQAVITPLQPLVESRTDNNCVVSPAHQIVSYVPQVDLGAALGPTWTLSSSGVDGRPLTGYASVVVSNLGNVAFPVGQRVKIQFVAHDTTDPAKGNKVLATLDNQSVSGLGSGGSMTFSPYINLPLGLPADTYEVQAIVTPVQAMTETRTDNDTATTPAHTITSTGASMDLAGTFGTTWTLPSSYLSGRPLTGIASVVVSNLGSASLPAGQRVTIQLVAHDTTDPAKGNIVLATLSNQSVNGLGPGRSTTFYVNVNLHDGLSPDTYQVQAILTPSPALSQLRTDNDVVTQTAAGAYKTIVVAQAFVDVAGVFGTYRTLPLSAGANSPLTGYVTVQVNNLGNLALPAGQKVDIVLKAYNTAHPADDGITLLTLKNQSVSGLGAGAMTTFYFYVNRSAGLPAGNYQLEAIISPAGSLSESRTDNNTVLRNTLGNTLEIVLH
jgi:hypothetical protein